MNKRNYRRRSDEERIAELEAKIEAVQRKMQQQKRPDEAVLRELPKVHKMLRRFAQMAVDNGRGDLASSTMAFMAGLDRMSHAVDAEPARRRARESDEAVEDFG